MTRMWSVDPTTLCEQHLVGEHAEMHQVVGTIEKHPHGTSIVQSHAEKGQIDTSSIQERHDALAAEMERRGLNHSSPMNFDDSLDIGSVDVADARRDLHNRCEDCRTRYEQRA